MSSSSGFPLTLSYTSFVIGIVSFAITILNLVALYADLVATLRGAPTEIRDALGNLRQAICEEREALRRQNRLLRGSRGQSRYQSRRRSGRHGASRADEGGPVLQPYADFSDETLSLHYVTLRDLWQQFKALERPFLVASGTRAEAIRRGDAWGEKDLEDGAVRADFERSGGEKGSTADWTALYRCDLVHRFIWWQSKADVIQLADRVQRLMLRRMEREVTQTRLMVKELREGRGYAGEPGGWDDGPGGRSGGGGPARSPSPHRRRSGTHYRTRSVREDTDSSFDERHPLPKKTSIRMARR